MIIYCALSLLRSLPINVVLFFTAILFNFVINKKDHNELNSTHLKTLIKLTELEEQSLHNPVYVEIDSDEPQRLLID